MKTIRIIFLVLFCGVIVAPIFSQTDISWMKHEKRIILDKVMNIEFIHPEGFIGDSLLMCLDIDLSDVSLMSDDGSFRVFYCIYPPLSKEDAVKYSLYLNKRKDDLKNFSYLNRIVEVPFGKNADWKDHVSYYSQQIAKDKFNADTVVLMSLPPEIHDDFDYDNNRNNYYFNAVNRQYNSNYTHGNVLCIQKIGRGSLTLYIFYDEKATKNLDAYMEAIERTIRYRDGEPEMRYIRDDSIIIVCPGIMRQKKTERIGN